jgi:hypothetical protein
MMHESFYNRKEDVIENTSFSNNTRNAYFRMRKLILLFLAWIDELRFHVVNDEIFPGWRGLMN